MKINFTKFRQDFVSAVADLEKKYNIDISIGNITYDDISFHTKMKCTLNTVDVQKLEFEKYCGMHGFTKTDYLRPFIFKGENYILTGFNPNASKYKALATRIKTGDQYSFIISEVRAGLK